MKCKYRIATARSANTSRPRHRDRSGRSRAVIASAIVLFLGLAASQPAEAWTAPMHVEIARQAATIAPPDLFRQIERNEEAFSAGIAAALKGRNHSSGGEALLSSIRGGSQSVIAAIEAHEPFQRVVRELGRLAVYAAEANNPLKYAGGDRQTAGYRDDYTSYLATAFSRFEPVFYGDGRDVRTLAGLEHMLTTTGRRGAELHPLVAIEYRRIGAVDGAALFDDKSTAFGVGSIAFSHAISDTAAIYRYIWLRAGGGDQRRLPLTRPVPAARASQKALGARGR